MRPKEKKETELDWVILRELLWRLQFGFCWEEFAGCVLTGDPV